MFLIGPQRLPEYAEKLRELVKAAKRYATGATDGLKETLGPEIADVDWRKLDPRQYDPRTIVRQALLEDDDEPAQAGGILDGQHPGTGLGVDWGSRPVQQVRYTALDDLRCRARLLTAPRPPRVLPNS